jgi:tetratricopeptide (TPR) repeat protein
MARQLSCSYRVSWWGIVLGAALLIPAFCAGQNNSPSEERLAGIFSQAKAAQQRGDYRTAANCYEEIVKLRPDIPEAWANLGLMHQFLQEYPQADRAFRTALGKNPQLYVPNLFLGLNQLQEQQPAIALHYLKRAEGLNPKDEQAAMGLAHSYQLLQDKANAIKWFSRAAELKSDDPDVWYGLAVAYLSLQDAAVIELGKLAPDQVQARTLVADAFVMQGRTKDAIAIYRQFMGTPERPPCMPAALGFAYAEQGSELASRTFQDAIKKEPGCLTARLGLAHLAVENGNLAEALRQIQEAWEADRNFVRANVQRVWKGIGVDELNKADAWIRQNSEPGSLAQSLEQSLEGTVDFHSYQPEKPHPAPTSADDSWAGGHYTACAARLQQEKTQPSAGKALLLAQCSYYAGGYRASLAASEAALRIRPQSLPALYWKAKSSQELATDALNRMSAAAPDSPKVHLMLGELHRVREEFNAAESEYMRVIRSQPNDPAAHVGLAQVFYGESQDDKAQQQLQAVLQADPTSPQAGFVMAQVLVRRHQFAEAVPYLKTALNGSPLILPQVHSLLARCYAADGNYAAAAEELKPALPADKNGVYHYQLYQLYQKLGDAKAAAVALQESEKLRREGAAPAEHN